jgi:hypothetical protein
MFEKHRPWATAVMVVFGILSISLEGSAQAIVKTLAWIVFVPLFSFIMWCCIQDDKEKTKEAETKTIQPK